MSCLLKDIRRRTLLLEKDKKKNYTYQFCSNQIFIQNLFVPIKYNMQMTAYVPYLLSILNLILRTVLLVRGEFGTLVPYLCNKSTVLCSTIYSLKLWSHTCRNCHLTDSQKTWNFFWIDASYGSLQIFLHEQKLYILFHSILTDVFDLQKVNYVWHQNKSIFYVRV